jgi:RecG-like helicase
MKKQMPKSEARPLGTSKSQIKRRKTMGATTPVSGEPDTNVTDVALQAAAETADAQQTQENNSLTNAENVIAFPKTETGNNAQQTTERKGSQNVMNLTLSTKNRKGSSVVFNTPDGVRGSVRVNKSVFANGQIPQSLTIEGAEFAQPKPKLTPEERKAQRAAQPKLTAAERVQKMEERLAKAKAKLAAQAQPATV